MRIDNEDNNLPTYKRTEAHTICSKQTMPCEKGYMIRIAVSFPCPIDDFGMKNGETNMKSYTEPLE